MKKTIGQLTFFDHGKRLEKVNEFDKLRGLRELIPWESFRKALEQGACRSSNPALGGRPAFDVVKMFKVLILQRLYNLSDEDTEFRINDSFSFQRFVGIGVEEAVPDAKTIWLFRENLTKSGCLKGIFSKLNLYLAAKGYAATHGTIVDATVISVPKTELVEQHYEDIKAGELPKELESNSSKRSQIDLDARITKKRGKWFYGYKNHVNVDAKHKLICSFAVSDAAMHDSKAIQELVSAKSMGAKLATWADSAYDTQAVRQHLRSQGITPLIQKQRRSSLTPENKYHALNSRLSKVRMRVEHVFAYQVVVMKAALIRCIGKTRAEAIITLNNLTYNMMRYKFLAT